MFSGYGRKVVKLVAQTAYLATLIGLTDTAIEAVVDPQDESTKDTCEKASVVIGSVIWWRTGGVVNHVVDRIADALPHKAEQAEETDAVQ